jgi:hypothetical protein
MYVWDLIMSQFEELPLASQFKIVAFEQQVKQMSHEQTQQVLINLFRHHEIQRLSYEKLLAHQWGLDEPFKQEE